MHLSFFIFTALLPLCYSLFGFIGSLQTVGVIANLRCNGTEAANVIGKLFEEDILYDDLLCEARTSASGILVLVGNKREISTLEPILYMYHKCGYKGKCYKTIEIRIPPIYVEEGEIPRAAFRPSTEGTPGLFELSYNLNKQKVTCLRNADDI